MATGGAIVGVSRRYKQVLARIISWMIDNRSFLDMPVSVVPEEFFPALDDLLHEDVIFRKDLSTQGGVLDDAVEVVNFTFDEFRDFLIADHIGSRITPDNSGQWESIITELVDGKSPVAEGLSRYLFYAAKRQQFPELRPLVDRQRCFDDIFIECIFGVEDSFIDDRDVARVRLRYGTSFHDTETITWSLIRRWHEDRYPTLNIGVLFAWWDEMSNEDFEEKVRPVFDRIWMVESAEHLGYVDAIVDHAMHLASEGVPELTLAASRLVEVLLYLLDVRRLAAEDGPLWAIDYVNSHAQNLLLSAIDSHVQHGPARSCAAAYDLTASLVAHGAHISTHIPDRALAVVRDSQGLRGPGAVLASCAAEVLLAAHQKLDYPLSQETHQEVTRLLKTRGSGITR